MPNFRWNDQSKTITDHVQLTLAQVGSVLQALRYLRQLEQSGVAAAATARLPGPQRADPITQGDISQLERGILPANMRGGNHRLKAVLDALDYREADKVEIIDLVKALSRFLL